MLCWLLPSLYYVLSRAAPDFTVVAHEYGHNWGLGHTMRLTEYGGEFDVKSPSGALHTHYDLRRGLPLMLNTISYTCPPAAPLPNR